MILDVECYRDYFLVSFLDTSRNKIAAIDTWPGAELNTALIGKVMRKHTTYSFNGLSYDLPMIAYALSGATCEQLKSLSDEIITSGRPSWAVCRDRNIRIPTAWRHIDLIEVAPGQASLKIYGGRLGAPTMQDLPIEPSASISPAQREQLRTYCANDLRTTAALRDKLRQQLDLRASMGEQYGVDLMSKSDAQIAEAVLKHELEAQGVSVSKNPVKTGHVIKYNPPRFLRYRSPILQSAYLSAINADYVVKDNGQVQLPDELKTPVKYAGGSYAMGIGGLHSQEKQQAIVCGPDEMLFDADFASYYPFIILGERYYPRHLGSGFLDVYRSIVERRIAAKHSQDNVTANSLKIVINSSFGKLGSKFSYLYSPDLLIQTTITGQLCLLMLIEMVTDAGGDVVSANTDGIVIRCKRNVYPAIASAMLEFELLSGYTLEETEYKGLYSANVNNYLAVKTNGKTKGKGAFAGGGLMKNPDALIIYDAVAEHIANGTPIADTITQCRDPLRFAKVRSVTGGAMWRGEYLGKAVRFYYSTDGDSIHYRKNGNKVPKSDGAKPMMIVPDALPCDVDFDRYITQALTLLEEVGC